jgi:hypothetical protein
MEIILHECSASRTARYLWLAKKEIKHSTDSTRHYETNEDPQLHTHGATRSINADKAHHHDVESQQQSPRQVEVDAQSKRKKVWLG